MKIWQNRFIVILISFAVRKSEQSTPGDQYDSEFGEVVHVSAIFRHGDRSLYASYSQDPHINHSWPDGLGQLQKAGQQRLYNLGKWYRHKYSELVKTVSSHTNLTVWSSDIDRTIMSAECFLAGFYPPEKSQYLDKKLPWQPVPVHTIPEEHDNMISIRTKDRCAAKLYLAHKVFNRKKTKRIYDKYKNTFDYLHNHTGYNFSRDNVYESVTNVDALYDILFVEDKNNLPLPSWTKKVFPRPMLTILEALLCKETSFSLKAKRLHAGPLLKSVVSNMIEKTETKSTKLFHFYSGHDHTIVTIASAFGFRMDAVPPYGSSFIFELRKKQKQYFVTVFYANSMTKAPYFVSIPKCGSSCTLRKFVRATNRLIPKDWDSECRVKKKQI